MITHLNNQVLLFKICISSNVQLPAHQFSSSEIPQFRLPYTVVDFEIQLAKDIGVKVCLVLCFSKFNDNSFFPISEIIFYFTFQLIFR